MCSIQCLALKDSKNKRKLIKLTSCIFFSHMEDRTPGPVGWTQQASAVALLLWVTVLLLSFPSARVARSYTTKIHFPWRFQCVGVYKHKWTVVVCTRSYTTKIHSLLRLCLCETQVNICVLCVLFDPETVFTYSFMFIKIAWVFILKT